MYVLSHVPSSCLLLRIFFTQFALVWFFTSLCPFMVLQGNYSGKCFVSRQTLERFLTSVCSFMIHQTAFQFKSLITNWTVKITSLSWPHYCNESQYFLENLISTWNNHWLTGNGWKSPILRYFVKCCSFFSIKLP